MDKDEGSLEASLNTFLMKPNVKLVSYSQQDLKIKQRRYE